MSPLKGDETPQTTIHDVFMSCIENDVTIKTTIIEMIPEDFVDHMRNYLDEEKKLYKKYNNGSELPEEDYSKIVAGRIFEVLNYQEYSKRIFSGLTPDTEEWKRAEDILFVSSTLCKIARYPDEYGLKIDKYARIPDGVYTGITKEGNFYVYGLAEAKLGALSDSALDQIRLSGSRTTMARIVEQVQEIISLSSVEKMHPEIAQLAKVLRDRHLEVKWDTDKKGEQTPRMSLELLVPTRGDDFFNSSVLLEKSSMGAEFGLIQNQQRVTSRTSCFTTQDVYQMTNAVMERM